MDKRYLIVGMATIIILVGIGCSKTTNNIISQKQEVKNTEQNKPTQKTVIAEKQINTPDSQIEIKAKLNVSDENNQLQTITPQPANVINNCSDQKCFEEKFINCQKAIFNAEIEGFEIGYYYEIIGLKNGKCEMKTKYTKNPNPDWVNKEMVCLYDNKKPFLTAVEETQSKLWMEKDITGCQGDLAKILTTNY